MKQYIIIAEVNLLPSHQPTYKTRHYRHNVEIPLPSKLRIVQYPDDSGYYLLYLDHSSQELTDTYHDSMTDALSQANFEFQVSADDWDFHT
jgi:hypothetical protein